MISQLHGILIEKQPPYLLLDVQGVGYQLSCPMSTFYVLNKTTSEKITLHTHLVVREDAWQLYGFASRDERRLFRILIKINGVGPKLALTILSGMELAEFIACVTAGDHKRLVCIPGIGKKTGERITIEARDAIAKWQAGTQNNLLATANQPADVDSSPYKLAEAHRALLALGYKEAEASRVMAELRRHIADEETSPSTEELIRQALKQLALPA